MIYKEPGLVAGTVRVTFELPSTVWAEHVTLVGSFNDWDKVRTPMRQSGYDGSWRVTLELEAGHEYQYRYLIDGETWHTDYSADGYATNEYGSDNAVVNTALEGEPPSDGQQSAGGAPDPAPDGPLELPHPSFPVNAEPQHRAAQSSPGSSPA